MVLASSHRKALNLDHENILDSKALTIFFFFSYVIIHSLQVLFVSSSLFSFFLSSWKICLRFIISVSTILWIISTLNLCTFCFKWAFWYFITKLWNCLHHLPSCICSHKQTCYVHNCVIKYLAISTQQITPVVSHLSVSSTFTANTNKFVPPEVQVLYFQNAIQFNDRWLVFQTFQLPFSMTRIQV